MIMEVEDDSENGEANKGILDLFDLQAISIG